MFGRKRMEKWWPDQAIGTLLFISYSWALCGGENSALGTGVGKVFGVSFALGYFAVLAVAGVAVIGAAERERPRVVAVGLYVAAAAFLLNAAVTGLPSGSGEAARSAAGAYSIAASLLLYRGRYAARLASRGGAV